MIFGALATTGAESSSGMGSWMTIIYIVLLIAVFYFLLIRPQSKQKKERAAMMNSLTIGDEIYTIGGILGTVTRIKENTIWLRISEKTEIEVLKSSIGGINNKNNGVPQE